jgi:hypothetical protein
LTYIGKENAKLEGEEKKEQEKTQNSFFKEKL